VAGVSFPPTLTGEDPHQFSGEGSLRSSPLCRSSREENVYTTTQPVRLYVSEIGGSFGIVRTGTGNVFAEVSLAGYLEDAP
jgi:hypothetical protein